MKSVLRTLFAESDRPLVQTHPDCQTLPPLLSRRRSHPKGNTDEIDPTKIRPAAIEG